MNEVKAVQVREPLTIGATKPYYCKRCGMAIARVTMDDRMLVIGDSVWLERTRWLHAGCGKTNHWGPARR